MQQQYERGDLVKFTDEIYQTDNISPNWKNAVKKARGKAIRVIGFYSDTIVKLELPNGPNAYCLTSIKYIEPYQEPVDTERFLDILAGDDSDAV